MSPLSPIRSGSADDILPLPVLGYETGSYIWRDEGGRDALLIGGFNSVSLPTFTASAEEVVFENHSLQITMPTEDTYVPTIEYVMWSTLAFEYPSEDSGPDRLLSTTRQRIVIDPAQQDALSAGGNLTEHSLWIGGNGADDFVLRGSEDLGEGFSAAFGGKGRDLMEASGALDVLLVGGAGRDVLRATGDGAATLDGGLGDDRLVGGTGNDEMIGGKGKDVLLGGAGDDHLWGDGFFGFLSSARVKDRVKGGAGNDTLEGGMDGDRLWGGEGADLFSFEIGRGGHHDRIKDFNAMEDSIYLDTHTIRGRLKAIEKDGDTHLKFGRNKFAVLEGVELGLDDINFETI